jgi:hypothetical protein
LKEQKQGKKKKKNIMIKCVLFSLSSMMFWYIRLSIECIVSIKREKKIVRLIKAKIYVFHRCGCDKKQEREK